MALGARIIGKDFRTWVMLGDGEIQEGQIWEAAFIASRYELENLTAILDWNHLQQFGWSTQAGYANSARRDPTDSPAEKWKAFGWHVIECDGHDAADFLRACTEARAMRRRPTLILAHTVKGKGVSFMENEFSWHSRPISDDDLRRALEEIDRADRLSAAQQGGVR
jgi:transketolase